MVGYITEKWKIYYGMILPALEAVFLPIRLEFKEAIVSKFSGEIDIRVLMLDAFKNDIFALFMPHIEEFVSIFNLYKSEGNINDIARQFPDERSDQNSFEQNDISYLRSVDEDFRVLIQMITVLCEVSSVLINKEMFDLAVRIRRFH
ncbi:hypothetical protein BB560_000036 [Smittium megazygosporum]|uniref:Uncharacterized protein n=1 Tax=Smittium megazygosporum TaxID=133381 RepID=A0A2T9ZLH0_9FUNG|nr:hypothetical protein BB560_000036 [Smittium megazygosporum]